MLDIFGLVAGGAIVIIKEANSGLPFVRLVVASKISTITDQSNEAISPIQSFT
jgi:hypothetical protein